MANAERWIFVLKLAAALGCGLMAGVFFAFSAFVMGALTRLPPAHGLSAMQSINVRVLNPVFLGAFMGTAAACLVLAGASFLRWGQPGAAWALAGCLLYLAGTFGVTVACNVPLNDSLALLKPGQPGSEAAWSSYASAWTAWNHVRTIAALAATAALIMALSAASGKGRAPRGQAERPAASSRTHESTLQSK